MLLPTTGNFPCPYGLVIMAAERGNAQVEGCGGWRYRVQGVTGEGKIWPVRVREAGGGRAKGNAV